MARPKILLLATLLVAGAAWAWRGRAATLPDAQLAQAIPVYPGADYEDMGTGLLGDDLSNMDTRSRTWWFTVGDPQAKVAAFYARELEVQPETDEDGMQTFEVKPPGARAGELVTVTLEPGKLTIHEAVKLKR